ncbi:MAG: dihydrofolate reductase [Chitinophagaceae bacterium]|nr:MAG: dihydrofolate reductase [Chitinophagaceae bacterium]
MRPLIYAINLTADGCCDHTKGQPDEELHNYHRDLLHESDTFLYGRKTYELMVPYWPDLAKHPGDDASSNEFAKAFEAVREIIVFSRTLGDNPDPKTHVLSGELREEIQKLKNREGKAILTGGVDLPSQLIALDLVDEFCFVIQPLLVGEGRRLPEAALQALQLKLVENRTFGSGAVAMRYRRAK